MKTKNNLKLDEKIYNALNEKKKFPDRDYNVEADYFENKPRTVVGAFWELKDKIYGKVLDFNESLSTSLDNNSKYNNFIKRRMTLERNELEAMVLIPEEEKVAIVKRISYHKPKSFHTGQGFLTPKYTEEGLSSLTDALARKFSDQDYLAIKTSLLNAWKSILPEYFGEFYKEKAQIIQGINNASFGKHNEEHVEIDNLAYFLGEMGFSGKDKDIIKPLWDIAKKSPRGTAGKSTWSLLGDYLMEHKPEIITNFDFIKKDISRFSLADCLSGISLNSSFEPKGDEDPSSKKNYDSVFEFIDKSF